MFSLSALRMINLEMETNWQKDHVYETTDKEKLTNAINQKIVI